MVFLGRVALAAFPPVLFGLYAFRPNLAFLCLYAVLPWVLLYAGDRSRPRPSYLYYFGSSYAVWILLYTPAFQYGWFAPFLLGVFGVVTWWPFAPILSRIHRRYRLPRSLTVALAWTALEWFRTTFVLSHFDLYGLGYAMARFPVLVQIADLGGVYLVTFLMAAFQGWIADVVFAWRGVDGKAGLRGLAALRSGAVLAGGALVFGAIAATVAYGMVRLSTTRLEAGPRVAIIQPNTKHTHQNIVGVHMTQMLMSDETVKRGEADLIVWPENAIMHNIRHPGVYLDDLAWLAEEKDAWLLVGANGRPPGRPGRTTNGAYLVDDHGVIRGQYDKQVLFPWTEYIPFDAWLERWSPSVQRLNRELTRIAWGFQPNGAPGERMEVLEFPWNGEMLPIAALICVENTYPPLPAEAGRSGARMFVNITSEGQAAGPVQEQLLRMAMLRAIENRMAYVRAGNTGISAVIDPTGQVRQVLRDERGRAIETAGVLIGDVPLSGGGVTTYAKSRDAFVLVVVFATFALWLVSWFRRPRAARAAAAAAIVAGVVGLVGCARPPALGTDPAGVDAAIEAARQARIAGDHGSAIEAMARACATEEGCRVVLADFAAAYDGLAVQDDRAVLLFRDIAERWPAIAPTARGYEAVFLKRARDFRGAIEAFRESVAGRPDAAMYGRLGNTLLASDRPAEAIEAFRSAVELEPNDIQLRYLLGRALRSLGDATGDEAAREEARSVLRAVVEDRPSHGNAWTNLGRLDLAAGNDEEAEIAFRTAVRVEPGIIEARFMMARTALRRGEHDVVRELIREIQRIEAGFGRGPARD